MLPRVPQVRARTDRALTCTGRLREIVGVGEDDDGFTITLYEDRYIGRCLVYPADRDSQAVDVGGSGTWLVTRYTVILPADAEVEVGFVLDLTSSPYQPNLADGRLWRITDAPVDAWAAVRHCMAESSAQT